MSDTSVDVAELAEPDLSGRRLGDYQVLRRLGRGGMAEVYLAEQVSLRRQVALKVLKRSLAGQSSYVKRFSNEAQAAARLVHANIVQIYEVGCTEGVHYIAQEYVAGPNLKQLLNKRGRGLDAPFALSVVRQVAAALHKAGQQGIIHRDIKPENIMLTPAGEAKVTDFGLARVADAGDLQLTRVGITMGTPLYMSPEQVEGRAVDHRSDLYSFGVTCYHMLSGLPPFTGETALAVAVQHLKNEPQRLELLRPDLPEGLCRIVHKLLAKKPDDRHASAADLLRELRALGGDPLPEEGQELAEWSTPELLALTDARVAATQQLQQVLARQPRTWSAARVAGLLAAALLAAFIVGVIVARANRPPSLLAFSEQELRPIERFETPQEQLLHARLVRTERAWQAVAKNFPPSDSPQNLRYSRLALQDLAQYYRERNQLDQSLAAYQQLGEAEERDGPFRAIGLAGQALVLDELGQAAEAKELLPRVLPRARQLPDDLRGELLRLAGKHQIPVNGE